MTDHYLEIIDDSIDIEATPAQVWNLVGNLRRMPEWSPQVDSVTLRPGFEKIGPGAELTHTNHEGELSWTTHSVVVRYDPEREIAFRVDENYVVWAFLLGPSPSGGGVELTERRETPEGISDYSLQLTEKYLGGQQAFSATLRAGMRTTLERIKAAAELIAIEEAAAAR